MRGITGDMIEVLKIMNSVRMCMSVMVAVNGCSRIGARVCHLVCGRVHPRRHLSWLAAKISGCQSVKISIDTIALWFTNKWLVDSPWVETIKCPDKWSQRLIHTLAAGVNVSWANVVLYYIISQCPWPRGHGRIAVATQWLQSFRRARVSSRMRAGVSKASPILAGCHVKICLSVTTVGLCKIFALNKIWATRYSKM